MARKAKTPQRKSSKTKTKPLFTLLSENLLYVSMYSFVFIAIMAYVVTPIQKDTPKQSYQVASVLAAEENTYILPFLKPEEGVSFPILSAQGAVAVDIESGRILYEKNPDQLLFPASTVKMVTALVAMDTYLDNQVLTVGSRYVDGQKIGLYQGEKMTAKNLLNALLVYSANDAAEVLADNYPGGREMFVKAMNDKVAQIGANNTFLSNPTGLDGEGQVTTAFDMLKIAEYAMNNPDFAAIVGQASVQVNSVDGHNYFLESTNKLIGKVEGVLGVKTGWTENARENLVTYVKRDDARILITILGSQDRFGETRELIDWIYTNYNWEEIVYPVVISRNAR